MQGLKDLAVAIDLPETQGTESETQAKAAVRWLNSHPGWLLIVDNAIDAKSVSDLLPDSSNGHTIITSRNPSWGNIGEVVEVPPLSRVNAIDFLIGGSSQRDEYSAGLVAAELGDLPLALEQARAYMES
ncbi:MAG: toll/interleukin-1 receptor domain-containing protein, partial [Proteobacteria bacterium]|nr:toll/interleukin-1 receptor domain-containing protein [Pseudomonadota bacterium]